MPREAVYAVIVIAVVLSVQTIIMVAVAILLATSGRRLAASIDQKAHELDGRIDEVLREVRQGAQAVTHVTTHADEVMTGALGVVRAVAAVAGRRPSALLISGVASAAVRVLSMWRRRTRRG